MVTSKWLLLVLLLSVVSPILSIQSNICQETEDDCYNKQPENIVQVTLPQLGVLRGQILKTANGFSYKSFTGVPFAQPPLGQLRFQNPVSVSPWNSVYDATKNMKLCAQYDWWITKQFVGEEDCLYLNIFVPENVKKGEKLPVMFWVHGGGYTAGSGSPNVYGPDFLLQKNVILVSSNYRLGLFGFLCLHMKEAPGNMGLKDLAMALSWVNRHITYFGGDPDNVTLLGESAGAGAVHNLILAKSTQGQFKRAILQSGTAFSDWSVTEDPIKSAFTLGQELGLKTTNKTELINFLHKTSVKDLALSPLFSSHAHPIFKPVIEQQIPCVTPLITEDNRERVERGDFPKIPIMAGTTSNEGFLMVILNYERLYNKTLSNVSEAVPDFKEFVPLYLKLKFDAKKIELAAKKIKKFYFSNEEDDIINNYITLRSDYDFIKGVYYTAKKYSTYNSAYLYHFDYKGNYNIMDKLFPVKYRRACHADELGYIFDINSRLFASDPVQPGDILTVERMATLWTNFAKFGDPTPLLTESIPIKWMPVNEANNKTCLDIGDSLKLISIPYKERMKFWEDLEYI